MTEKPVLGLAAALLVIGSLGVPSAHAQDPRGNDLLVVDCKLPGQVRRLGQRTVYLSARRAARLTARDCQIRGGEYVEYDRADWASALGAWLPAAQAGDQEAQIIVGEIYERGLGTVPDYVKAAQWYQLAANAGNPRAQVNLGHLYERGLGVPADPRTAIMWYRRAAGLPDAVELDSGSAVVDDRSEEIAALQRELAKQREQAAQASEALAAALAEQQRLQERSRMLEQELEILNRQPDKSAEIAALQRELAKQSEQAAQATEALAAARAEQQKLAERARMQEEELARLQRSIEERLLAGPQLALIEPPLTTTRDIVPVATAREGERQVIGQVVAPAGAVSVTINQTPVELNEHGVFTHRIAVAPGETPVSIVAVDRQGKRAELSFVMRAAVAPPAAINASLPAARAPEVAVDFGNFHALIIGNNDYQFLPDLASPVNDAKELAAILERRYGFRTTVLLNATRYQILSALNELREKLTTQDNLLLYFAGHGELDEVNQRGHWLPVDAERHSTANWIPTTAVTDILNIMRAKQILVVVDSCYAGALTRSAMGRLRTGMTAEERLHWFRTMANKRSRTVLTSGGLAPVMDAGGGRHSVFAKALLEVLASSNDVLDGQRLHREVAARVAYAAANMQFDQVPEYAPIRYAGHEAGEFFLVPRM